MHKDKKTSLKIAFRLFFEGYTDPLDEFPIELTNQPIVDIPIHKFEIDGFEFFEFDEGIVMRISLGRPGILIGKAGRVVNALQEHLTKQMEKNVKIYIIESKLWR